MSVDVAKESGLDEHVLAFQEQGFVILRGVLEGSELAALQDESMAQIEAGPEREPRGHFKSAPGPGGEEVFFRIESTLTKSLRNDAVLHVMAHPMLLELLSRILPEGFVFWADAMLWKGATGGPGVPMHSAHAFNAPEAYENLVVDLYLDESGPHNGCLKVLPGSHKLPREENLELLELAYDVPGLVDVVMQPGDVLIHSEWMIHGSLPTPPLGKPSRRILYFAVQDPRAQLAENATPEQRRAIAGHIKRLEVAIEQRREATGEAWQGEVVPPGWEQDVSAIPAAEALAQPAAAC